MTMMMTMQHVVSGRVGTSHIAATSDSELQGDETASVSAQGRLSPRVSLAVTAVDDDAVLAAKQRKSSKFNIGQFSKNYYINGAAERFGSESRHLRRWAETGWGIPLPR